MFLGSMSGGETAGAMENVTSESFSFKEDKNADYIQIYRMKMLNKQ